MRNKKREETIEKKKEKRKKKETCEKDMGNKGVKALRGRVREMNRGQQREKKEKKRKG